MEFWLKDTTLARQSVAYRVAQIRPDVVINTGDIVDRGASPGAWKVFDEENAWLRRMGVPYYPALGNHEYQGGSTQTGLAATHAISSVSPTSTTSGGTSCGWVLLCS